MQQQNLIDPSNEEVEEKELQKRGPILKTSMRISNDG